MMFFSPPHLYPSHRACAVRWGHAGCLAAITLALTALGPHVATAQPPCPDEEVETAPEEQAICWYAEHAAGVPGCASSAEGEAPCAVNAASWCERAALDDPAVASACVLAFVAGGRLDALYPVLDSLPPELTAEAARCRGALLGPMPIRILTNPPGAEVSVDGRVLGPSPLALELAQPFLARQIAARFGAHEESVSEDELRAVFDPAGCSLGALVIDAPEEVRTAHEAARRRQAAPLQPPGRDDGASVAGAIVTSVGALTLAGALVSALMAESIAVDLANPSSGTAWSSARAQDANQVETLRTTGWALLATGAVVAGVGAALIIWDQSRDEDEPAAASLRLRLSPFGAFAEGRF